MTPVWRRKVCQGSAAIILASILAAGLESIAFAATSTSPTSLPADAYSIRWLPDQENTNRFNVEVSGLNGRTVERLKEYNWSRSEWERVFAVYVKPANSNSETGLPPVLGNYALDGGKIRFVPAYPLDNGVRYRALLYLDRLPGTEGRGIEPLASDFSIPRGRSIPSTVVRQVYPTANVLPENLLKFYLEFSGPMSGGHIYEHIHLRTAEGKDVELPFLEIDEELWDPAMTRLTLFIDPGRIKRGVRPLEEVGPALENGRNYTLVIDEDWPDAEGVRLVHTFEKKFKVGPPDREPIDPSGWRIQPPHPESVEPLAVVFPKPVDHALAQRVIRVIAPSGDGLEGRVTLGNEERQWEFHPLRPWDRGAYVLSVQTTIEDLAGNNVGKPFEVDVFEGVQRQFTNSIVKLPFEIR